MAEYGIPDAMKHRLIPSMFNDGDFPVPWIGDEPTLDERRQYMRGYLGWRLPHGDMETQERELRDVAKRDAAMKLMNDNVVEIGVEQFEWLIDEIFWHTWLGRLGNTPPFPWPYPTETDARTEISQFFDWWLDTYWREGDLVKAPESGDSVPDAEQHHLPDNETTIAERTDGSEQVDQLRQELRQRDEQISQRDITISGKDRRIRQLEGLLQLEHNHLNLLRHRNEDLQLENQDLKRRHRDALEGWRQALFELAEHLPPLNGGKKEGEGL